MRPLGLSDISPLARTKVDVDELLTQLDEIDSRLYGKNKGLESILTDVLPYDKKEILLALLRHYAIPLNDISAIQTFLTQIRSGISSLPIITLTIAFAPKDHTITRISQWLATQLARPVVLDISVDPAIIGGVVILYEGMYKDYSLHKRLLSHQDAFQAMLNAPGGVQ